MAGLTVIVHVMLISFMTAARFVGLAGVVVLNLIRDLSDLVVVIVVHMCVVIAFTDKHRERKNGGSRLTT